MPYYFDLYGWHTNEVLHGRETDIAPPADIPEGHAANFTGHKWVVVPYVVPPPPPPQLPVDDVRAQLAVIDQKKVRAMTDALLSGDLSRLRQLEDEAATLRALL